THEPAYVLRDPATLPEAEQVTAQGLTDAVSHARATVKMRMLLDTATGACLHRALDELRATAPPAACSPEIRRVTAGRVAFAAASCVAQIVVVAAPEVRWRAAGRRDGRFDVLPLVD